MEKAAKEKKYFALFLLALFVFFFLYAAVPFLLGISGAAILYVVLKPLYLRAYKKLNHKCISASIVLLLSLILIILPLFLIIYLSIVDLSNLLSNQENVDLLLSLISFGGKNLDFTAIVESHILEISGAATEISLLAINTVIGVIINLVVMYIILYYLLTENEKASKTMKSLLPFNKKNSERLMREYYTVINATFVGNVVVAIIIGVLLTAGFFLIGMGNLLFWAVLSTITAIVPIIGIQILWIPVGLYHLFEGNYASGAGIMIWGAFLSYLFDGYVRQFVQSRIASIHPFISLIGLIIGITYFGVTGIIIGPLLIAIFVLTAGMFWDEYLPNWK